jgi:CDP-paratose 2-epimerase
MKVLITGVCGFTGSTIARALHDLDSTIELFDIDNFIRPGSERNRTPLQSASVALCHGDVRHASDVESLPGVDWIIDAAANPSVLSGVDGKSSSRQVGEHNLFGRQICWSIVKEPARASSFSALAVFIRSLHWRTCRSR